MTSEWWRTAAIYQIYPRSFADANGDGMGDLAGITSRLGDLQELGIDAIWLSPFYTSPQRDAGYDVADYCDVDPRFGTLADFDAMLAEAHARGIRVIIDLVPNHSSDEHEWFQAALAAPAGSAERARYLFRDGRGPGGDEPPNNWESVFGGPAWTRVVEPDGTAGQWYLHLFDSSQPDFDWTNEEVREEFRRILRFWLDRGVDGFRVDVAHGMIKADGLPDYTPPAEGGSMGGAGGVRGGVGRIGRVGRSVGRVGRVGRARRARGCRGRVCGGARSRDIRLCSRRLGRRAAGASGGSATRRPSVPTRPVSPSSPRSATTARRRRALLGPGRRARDLPRLARPARRVPRRAHPRRRGVGRPAPPRREVGAPRRDAPGVQLRLPRDAVERRGAPHGHRRLALGVRRGRRTVDLGALQPRRRAPRDAALGHRGEPAGPRPRPRSKGLPEYAPGLRRARAATALMLALPGSSYLYQGEELGLPEVIDLPDDARQDPTWFRTDGERYGRDGCRVPIPWEADAPNYGFGPAGDPWLPQPAQWAELARDRQRGVEGSTLSLYQDALRLRREHDLGAGSLEWLPGFPEPIVALRNGDVVVVANTGSEPVELPAGELLLASGPLDGRSLPHDTTAWLRA